MCSNNVGSIPRLGKSNESFAIAPNPTIGLIKITCPKDMVNTKLVITDLLGKVVYSNKLNDNQLEQIVDLSNLNTGIFIANFQKDNQILHSQKLVLIAGE